MKNLLLGSFAGLALIAGASAQAADMPAEPIVKAPAPAVAMVEWSGLYIGGHAGYAWSDVRFTFTDDQDNSEDLRFSPSSFMGGGQLGAQWQYDQWVLGLEGTWSAMSMNQMVPSTVTPGESHSINIDQTATATVKFGSVWDRALFYAKGGYAAARMNIHSVDTVNGITADNTRWRSGWTIGAGVDYMAFENVIVGAEFDYYNFNFDNTNGLYNDGVSTFSVAASNGNIYALMARASYLFK